MKKQRYLIESGVGYSKAERRAFLENLKTFHQYKSQIFREKALREICSEIGEILENVEVFTLEETKDWFDEQSVNRDLKELKTDYKIFEKTCQEVTVLQQRLESLYENIGTKLGKYYEI